MTLKEQFSEYVTHNSWDKEDYNALECEQIADDYAIGFGEWCLKIKFEPIENISVKKLLEIYKKEKGL